MRVLADGKTKFTILTTKPANPAAPTVAELNAGIDASCKVLQEGFNWTAAASDSIDEDALCATVNANTPGRGNSNLGFTAWEYFDDDTSIYDPAESEVIEAVKEKGTTLWGYTRKNGKDFDQDWASADVIDYGAEFVVDELQDVTGGGFIKKVVPCMAQNAWSRRTVGAGA